MGFTQVQQCCVGCGVAAYGGSVTDNRVPLWVPLVDIGRLCVRIHPGLLGDTAMNRILAGILLCGTVLAVPAYATLSVGAQAPDFTAQASLGGKEFSFSLADALRKGPVVLYFYPAAFTT
ncbi:MAG: redoxin domain-containing protein, partial [Rhizomicrobium sp.]